MLYNSKINVKYYLYLLYIICFLFPLYVYECILPACMWTPCRAVPEGADHLRPKFQTDVNCNVAPGT